MSDKCGESNPDEPSILCTKDVPCFSQHAAVIWNDATAELGTTVWPNAIQPPVKQAKGTLTTKAQAVEPEIRLGPPGPIVRTNDPDTSHLAAERIEPTRGSKREKVLTYLRERMGQWVEAHELATPEVGGFAGTRRMRELRTMGWNIETRLQPGSDTVWEHRLLDTPVMQDDPEPAMALANFD